MKKASEPSNSKYLQRINYLHQLEKFMLLQMNNPSIATYYGSVRDSLTKKAVLKVDPNLKRMRCKKCKCILYHSITAKVSTKRRRRKQIPTIQWKCLNCNYVKNYRLAKDKKIWYENPESIVEIQSHE